MIFWAALTGYLVAGVIIAATRADAVTPPWYAPLARVVLWPALIWPGR